MRERERLKGLLRLSIAREKGNKAAGKRVSLEQNESCEAEGGPTVVKGVSKRIIVVPSPDPRIFEQAIFIVREEFVGQAGVSEREVLRQARQAANNFLRTGDRPRRTAALARLRGALYAAAGAAAAALAWVMIQMAQV